MPDRRRSSGFLELVDPDLPKALEALWQQGFRQITAYGLADGRQPRQKRHPGDPQRLSGQTSGLEITFGADLGIHPYLLQVARERIESVEAHFGPDYARQETLLVVDAAVLTLMPMPTSARSPGYCGKVHGLWLGGNRLYRSGSTVDG